MTEQYQTLNSETELGIPLSQLTYRLKMLLAREQDIVYPVPLDFVITIPGFALLDLLSLRLCYLVTMSALGYVVPCQKLVYDEVWNNREQF